MIYGEKKLDFVLNVWLFIHNLNFMSKGLYSQLFVKSTLTRITNTLRIKTNMRKLCGPRDIFVFGVFVCSIQPGITG